MTWIAKLIKDKITIIKRIIDPLLGEVEEKKDLTIEEFNNLNKPIIVKKINIKKEYLPQHSFLLSQVNTVKTPQNMLS